MGRGRKLVHLSDLHFGRTRPELLEPLIAAVNGAGADLVAISGDLTQRARNWQFHAARDFIARLRAPCLVVPGNHDVPLDNLMTRMLDPWRRYRRWIGTDLAPVWHDAELCVVGLNTVDPFSWQRGRAGGSAIRRVCRVFRDAPETRLRILVAHHPFEHLPQEAKSPMRGAGRGMDLLSACGADIVLSGHLHSWRAEPFVARPGRRGALQVLAGTGLSTRLRGESNDFNVLNLAAGEVAVERFVAASGTEGFERAAVARFALRADGWMAMPA